MFLSFILRYSIPFYYIYRKKSIYSFHIPPACDNPVAGIFNPQFQAIPTLSRLLPGTDFIVIQGIFLPYIRRGQVGHNDIGARFQAFLSSERIHGSQGCGGRQQDIGKHDPQY